MRVFWETQTVYDVCVCVVRKRVYRIKFLNDAENVWVGGKENSLKTKHNFALDSLVRLISLDTYGNIPKISNVGKYLLPKTGHGHDICILTTTTVNQSFRAFRINWYWAGKIKCNCHQSSVGLSGSLRGVASTTQTGNGKWQRQGASHTAVCLCRVCAIVCLYNSQSTTQIYTTTVAPSHSIAHADCINVHCAYIHIANVRRRTLK